MPSSLQNNKPTLQILEKHIHGPCYELKGKLLKKITSFKFHEVNSVVWGNEIFWADQPVTVGNSSKRRTQEYQQKGSHLTQERHKMKGLHVLLIVLNLQPLLVGICI